MSSLYTLISFSAAFFLVHVYGDNASDECQPKPHAPGKNNEICCEMPDPMMNKDDEEAHKALHGCIEILKEKFPEIFPGKFHEPPPGKGVTRPRPPHPHPRGPSPVQFMECVQQCIYNNSGLMTPEMKPSPDAVQKMVYELIRNDENWGPIASKAVKKCTQNSPNISDGAVCKSGAYQTTVCLMREMYMNCPEEYWNDSEECKAGKEQLEKCPNMPPRIRMGHRGGYNKKH